MAIVIPGRREATNPESRRFAGLLDSGPREDACPGMTASQGVTGGHFGMS
jgi:hypothetical protein